VTIVGVTSDAQLVTVKNSGSAALTIQLDRAGRHQCHIVRRAGDMRGNACGGRLMHVVCGIQAGGLGGADGTVSITDNAAGSPQKVTLTGRVRRRHR